MSCELYRSALTDVALGVPAPSVVEAHLAGCESCGAALERERRLVARIDSELAGALDVEPSSDLPARARLRAAQPAQALRFRPGRLAAAAALVAASLAAAHFLARREGAGPRPAVVAETRPAPSPAPREQPRAAPVEDAESAGVRVTRTPRRPAEPEVLVPPEQEALVARLAQILRSRPLEPAAPPATATFEASGLNDARVAPIEVEPLRLEASDIRPLTVEPIALERLSLEPSD